jgi:tetratricopeptide (TPR) repeat protein
MSCPNRIPERKAPTASKFDPFRKQNEIGQLFMLGLAFHQQGQFAQANQIYQQILGTHPTHFDALHLAGVLAAQTGKFTLAVDLIGRAIEINPKIADTYSNRGNALKEMKRFEEAVASHDMAIGIKPDYAEAYSNRGNALKELKRLEEAVASYDTAIAIKPDYAEAYSNRGVTLYELKRFEEAVASYDAAIAIKPDYAEAYSNRGNALNRFNRFEEAVVNFDKAIEINPGYAEAYSNRGVALYELKRFEEAVASYDMAIAIKPDYAEAYWNKSLALLVNGDFERGWNLYEWRWQSESSDFKRDFVQPLWLGTENISGKTILLHAEQGLGDTIQFCRYAELVKAKGARVLLEVPSELQCLLAGLKGVDDLLVKDKVLPAFDYHCPLLSLPLAFKTDLTNIPSPKPYLDVSLQKRKEWAQRLAKKDKPRVGLVWSGSTGHKNDHNRSLTLQQILPYLPLGIEYVSLQKELRTVDKHFIELSGIKHYGDEFKDFTDTAAICDLMDLVISVDTSVAHLAAAIGKTTWVLLPYAPDWRWLLDRDDSPWYQSMKLYRQYEDMEWGPVLERMIQDLRRHL